MRTFPSSTGTTARRKRSCGAPDGRKLSKREGDLNMEALRQKYTPEQLTGKLAKLAGLRPTDAPVTAAELAADFSWDKVPRADIPIPEDF